MTTGGIGNNPGGWFGPAADPTRSSASDRPTTPLGFNISPLGLPQDMKTLVYSPEVRIVISHGNTQIDVSRDLISGTVIRKENSASSLFFTVANVGNYNTAFARMDRVVCWMKRIRWEQVFAGYLDTVPYRQLYGGAAEFKATCTLKRLLYTYWNPGLPDSAKIFDQLTLGNLAGGDGQRPVDTGLGDLLREILIRVGGWQINNIYIQTFPMQFWEWMKANVMANVGANRAQVDKFQHLLLGVDWNTYAPGQYAGYNANAGAPGAPGAGEPFYIAEIVAACDARGMGPTTMDLKNSAALQDESVQAGVDDRQDRPAWAQVSQTMTVWNQSTIHNDAAVLGVACAMVETGGGATIMNWANPAVPDSMRFLNDGPNPRANIDSVGIFQQRANWGTVAQRMNPRQAATLFFTALSRQDWRNADPGTAIYNVQMGGSPEAFNAAVALAQQKVLAYREAQAGVTSTVMATPLGQAASSASDATGIGTNILNDAAGAIPQSAGEARSRVGKPDPDNEGAVMTILEQAGKPYQWGGEGPASFDCCLVGDTIVYGPEKAIPISELCPGDKVFSYQDKKLVTRSVVRQWRSEDQEVFKVRVRNRIVTGSANHPFLRLVFEKYPSGRKKRDGAVSTEWSRLDELSRGDFLVIPKNMQQKNSDDAFLPDGRIVTLGIAWLIGLCLGDGHVSKSSVSCAVWGDLAKRAENVFHTLEATSVSHYPNAGVVAFSQRLIDLFTSLGLHEYSRNRRIPNAVWSWGQDLQRAFLEGYCDADGHRPKNVSKHGQRTYSSTSKILVEEIRSLHIMLGDSVSNVSITRRTKQIIIKGKIVKNALPLHNFSVWSGVERGCYVADRRACKSLANWIDHGDFTIARILDIKSCGVAPTYDIEVEGDHNFIAGGLVVHNSGLMVYGFRSIGYELPHFTGDMRDTLPHVPLSNIQRGDMIITNGGNHVVLYLGGGACFAASTYGVPVGPVPMPAEIDAVLRVAENGGPDPSAPRIDPILAGPGMSPGTGQWAGNGTGMPTTNEPIALNLFAWMFIPSRFVNATALLFTQDHKEFIDSQPLMQMVRAVAGSSLRNFASAPNGDFMAYYPDYFGLDGKPAILRLEDIELKDVRINFTDDELTTHVYVNGDYTHGLADPNQLVGWLDTAGSVTVEHEWLFQRLTKIAPGDLGEFISGEALMRRFGVRPLQQTFTMAGSYELEFLLAAQIFMEKWARQYQTSVAFTFLPELFPGMRVLLANHNLQVYVSEVTHCLRGSERYLTRQGTKTLAETVGTTQMVLGHRGEWTPAEIRSFGEQELYRIVLSRYGMEKEIFATAPHRWFRARKRKTRRPRRGESKWVEATTSELLPGDTLRTVVKVPHRDRMRRLSPVGVQAGIVFGDGTVHKQTHMGLVRLFGEKDNQLLKWFPLNHSSGGTHPGGNYVFFTEVHDLPAYFKQPPPLDESAPYLYGWLAGYFAADGSVSSTGQGTISSTNCEHIRLVQDVCHVLGIRTFGLRAYTHNTIFKERCVSYRLQLDTEDLSEDFFLINSHRERAMKVKEGWEAKGRRKVQDWMVKSIESTGITEEVFCAVVPDGHAFVLEDNILTGNSWHFEQGFQTSAVIMAPSSPNAGSAMSSVGGALTGPNNTSVLQGLGFNADGTSATPMGNW